MPVARCGRSALMRAVASSMRLPTRALSTSVPRRLGSSGPRRGDSPSEAPAARRVNPLVGNLEPRQPPLPSNRLPDWLRSPRALAPAPRRVNPLIGSSVSAQPRPRPSRGSSQVPESPRPPPARASPSAAETPYPILSRPPPPPPPAAASSPPDTTEPDTTEPDTEPSYAYNAVSSSPLNLPVLDFLKNKSTELNDSRGVRDPQVLPTIRAKASAGRTVFVGERLTPSTAPTAVMAFRMLDRKCREQKIRLKYHSQKFHERPGLRRKRLKSQRWRARFKAGFKAAVNRVAELRRQGW